MRRRALHRRLFSGALTALVLVISPGCGPVPAVEPQRNDAETVQPPPVMPSVPASDPSAVRTIPVAPARDSAPSRTVADSSAAALPVDLSSLSAQLDVPVQGVTRAQLRDTYTEPRAGHVHEALDIPAARGTPVLSAASGRLLKLFDSKAGGLMVYATDTSERFILLYGHLDSYADGMTNGMQLHRGQVIGYVGTTGNAPPDTPHLHFGILRGDPGVSWSRGAAVNPYPLFVR
jgi:peptidoglycan LD-endopeptidase LytH